MFNKTVLSKFRHLSACHSTNYKATTLYILLFFCTYFPALSQKNQAENEIRNILKKQETAWNEGNLTKFMHGYWENDSLLFIGKTGVTRGYDNTLKNYLKSYSDTIQMGKFTSTIINITPLGNKHYWVLGKWHLVRTVGNLSGHYTLIFKKIKGEWKIISDHSS